MPALFDQGFFVRKPAWHQLGVVLDDYPGREEAMRLAGHDFDVIEVPAFVQSPDEEWLPVPDWKGLAVKREGQDVDTVIGYVHKSFQPIQNSVCWDIIDALVGLPNVRYETGATLNGGRQCFVTVVLDTPMQVPGDDSPIYPYTAVNWHHDGTGAVKAIKTSVREVCANTVAMAEDEASKSGIEYTFHHTKNVHDRIEDAKMALAGISDVTSAFMALATELAALSISDRQRENFITEFIPTPPAALISDRVAKNIDDARLVVRNLLTSSSTIPDAHRDTGYGLLMAGTEYLDHLRGYRSTNSYVGRTLLRREPLKDKLVPMIREIAAA